MLIYALVDNRLAETVDLYPSREEAEQSLADVLTDEPCWASFMSVEPIELPTSPNS